MTLTPLSCCEYFGRKTSWKCVQTAEKIHTKKALSAPLCCTETSLYFAFFPCMQHMLKCLSGLPSCFPPVSLMQRQYSATRGQHLPADKHSGKVASEFPVTVQVTTVETFLQLVFRIKLSSAIS